MIIKSKTRKKPTFSQLIDYMEQENKLDDKYNIYHNFFTNNTDKIKQEFKRNSQYLHKRKNGVYMYHEFVSIDIKGGLTNEQRKERLKEITLNYIQNRANGNLVYGVLHDDSKTNLHYHLIISSNKVEDSKRLRLSQKEFNQIRINSENRTILKYPELKQSIVMGKKAEIKLSHKGNELLRRTGKLPQKDRVKQELKNIFKQVKTKQEFFNSMSEVKLKIYTRGKNIGVVDELTGNKHRLKTLGLLDDFNKVSKIIELDHKIKQEDKPKQEYKPQQVKPQYKTERVKTVKDEPRPQAPKQKQSQRPKQEQPPQDDMNIKPSPSYNDIKQEIKREQQSREQMNIKETIFGKKQSQDQELTPEQKQEIEKQKIIDDRLARSQKMRQDKQELKQQQAPKQTPKQ